MNDADPQPRKQAEFLVRRSCPWVLVQEIGVVNAQMKTRVEPYEFCPSLLVLVKPAAKSKAEWQS